MCLTAYGCNRINRISLAIPVYFGTFDSETFLHPRFFYNLIFALEEDLGLGMAAFDQKNQEVREIDAVK